MNVYVDVEAGGAEEMEMRGWSLTWLTRARLPFSGARPEGNLTDRSMVGVKESGMMAEGRRFALFSESMSEVAIVVFFCLSFEL